MTAGILRRLRVQGVSSRAFGTLVNWGRNSWRDNSYDFQSQGLASRAKLGREVGAEKAAGACKQLQCMPGLILWGCCFISGPSPWGCCVEPTPPCLAPPRCDLEPLAQDSLCLETRWWTHSWGSKFWREGPALWCDIHGFTSHLLFLSRSASFSSVLVFSTGSSFRIVLKPWPVSVLQSSRPPAGRGTLVRKLSWAQGSICSPDYKLLDVRDHDSGGLSGARPRHLDLRCFWCK